MRRNIFVAIIAVVALVSLKLANSQSADTGVLAGNHPPAADTMAAIGDADATQSLEMEVRFASRNTAQLDELLKQQQDPASPNYRKWLSRNEFEQKFGVLPSDMRAVADWLKSEGFSVEPVSDGYLKFTGNVAQAQRSFAVRIAKFGDGTLYANVNDPTVPTQFVGVISNIVGLDNMTRAQPVTPNMAPRAKPLGTSSMKHHPTQLAMAQSEAAPDATASPAQNFGGGLSFGARDMRTFYDETVNSSQNGSGDCIAIVGISDFLDGALTTFQNNFMVAGDPVFNVTRIVHGTNPGTTQNGGEIEVEIDLEWSHAVAPGAPLHYHVGKTLLDDITGAINDSCGIVSISFEFCGAPSGYASMVDTVMKKGAALGESIFVSAGDHGAAGSPSNSCAPGTSRAVSEMSADPNVTSVGGTRFSPNYDSNGNDVGYSNNERVWNDPETGDGGSGATGGGESTVYAKPSYQSGPGVPADGMRDIPDIALIAGSPRVWFGDDQGGTATVNCCAGGTSLAAPIWAGFTRVLSQIIGTKLGPLNPEIYSLARQQFSQSAANGFHDITVGDNNFNGVTGFTAGPGYDQASGWGTIDFNVFASAVKNNATPTIAPTPAPTPGPLTVAPKFNLGAVKTGTTSLKAKPLKVSLPKKKGQVAAAFGNPVAMLTSGTSFLIDAASTTCQPASTGYTLPPGGHCVIGIKLKPANKGAVSDTLTILDNANGNPQHVTLTGKGT